MNNVDYNEGWTDFEKWKWFLDLMDIPYTSTEPMSYSPQKEIILSDTIYFNATIHTVTILFNNTEFGLDVFNRISKINIMEGYDTSLSDYNFVELLLAQYGIDFAEYSSNSCKYLVIWV